MNPLVDPHGASELRPLLLEGAALEAERTRAQALLTVRVGSRERGDLIMLGIGGFTPLAGFMGEADWRGVCDHMRCADGLFWPIPITLSVDEAAAAAIPADGQIALADPDDGHFAGGRGGPAFSTSPASSSWLSTMLSKADIDGRAPSTT